MPDGGAWFRGASGYGPGIPPPQPQQPRQAPQQNHSPAAPNPVEAQMASQLARLEGALAAMMPQVEAAMRQTPQQEIFAPGPSSLPTNRPTNNHSNGPAPVVTFGSESGGGGEGGGRVRSTSISPSSPLRDRRKMANLQVQPPARAEDPGVVVKNVVPETSVNPATVGPSTVESKPVKVEVPRPTIQTRAEKPRINAVRMVPLATDPESPRSPGRYSAWK